MRNDRRRDGRRTDESGFSLKSALYAAVIILVLGLVAFFVTMKIYNKNLEKAYTDIQSQDIRIIIKILQLSIRLKRQVLK